MPLYVLHGALTGHKLLFYKVTGTVNCPNGMNVDLAALLGYRRPPHHAHDATRVSAWSELEWGIGSPRTMTGMKGSNL